MDRFLFNQVTIAGVGLLGGSLGMALRSQRVARRVVGQVRRSEAAHTALRMGAIDAALTCPAEAVAGADLVVLCTPLARMTPLARELAPGLHPGTIVTDVGSVKAALAAELEPILQDAGARFIGGHPMAGSEKSGVEHARADLFHQAVCILTPTPTSNPDALDAVRALWTRLACQVLEMTPETHDELVSRSSHLPHLLATTLTRNVLCKERPPLQARLCATGFRDTTRVASGSPEMWRDIVLSNRTALLAALAGFEQDLSHLRQLVEKADGPALEALFTDARQRRNAWLATLDNPDLPGSEPT